MNLRLAEAQINAARAQGLHFFWEILFRDGRVVSQFDDRGSERLLMREAEWLVPKPLLDRYPYSIALRNVRAAYLIPTVQRLPLYFVEVAEDQELVLFRRNYLSVESDHYRVYVIGVRSYVLGEPIEETTVICPPHGRFPGAVETTTDPLHRDAFVRFSECA